MLRPMLLALAIDASKSFAKPAGFDCAKRGFRSTTTAPVAALKIELCFFCDRTASAGGSSK